MPLKFWLVIADELPLATAVPVTGLVEANAMLPLDACLYTRISRMAPLVVLTPDTLDEDEPDVGSVADFSSVAWTTWKVVAPADTELPFQLLNTAVSVHV